MDAKTEGSVSTKIERVASSGPLRFRHDGTELRIYLEVDEEIARYARALLPKSLRHNPPRHPPHITVVVAKLTKEEFIAIPAHIFSFGKPFAFEYDPLVVIGDTYIWLDVYADELEYYREQRGYARTDEHTRPPDGKAPFHMTAANRKGLT